MPDPTSPQPASEGVARPVSNSKSRKRMVEYGIVIVILALVVVAGLYLEPISAFFRLHMWDPGEASRTVEEFMGAVQKGDQQKAQSFIGPSELKPVTENGKWRGYMMVSIAGRMDYLPEDLAPKQGPPKANPPNFTDVGDVAIVTTTLDSGKSLKYRLKMTDGSWKIAEILGGRPHPK